MGTGQGGGMMGDNWGWGMGYGWGFGIITVILVVLVVAYMMKRGQKSERAKKSRAFQD
jgi:uncharacterized membrane protein